MLEMPHRREARIEALKRLLVALEENKQDADRFEAVLFEIARAAAPSPAVPVGFNHYPSPQGRLNHGETDQD
jgi:hypothetical protein